MTTPSPTNPTNPQTPLTKINESEIINPISNLSNESPRSLQSDPQTDPKPQKVGIASPADQIYITSLGQKGLNENC
jgi:hypothetical protein